MSTDRRGAILKRADRFEAKRVHRGFYFEPDHGDTVCERCLDKLVRAGLVVRDDPKDGQAEWYCEDPSADHDSQPLCEAPTFKIGGKEVGCGRWLQGWLTGYGAREELSHFEENGFSVRKGEHCYIWMLCENAFAEDSDEMRRLLKLARID